MTFKVLRIIYRIMTLF